MTNSATPTTPTRVELLANARRLAFDSVARLRDALVLLDEMDEFPEHADDAVVELADVLGGVAVAALAALAVATDSHPTDSCVEAQAVTVAAFLREGNYAAGYQAAYGL